jgi:hypothetical protein
MQHRARIFRVLVPLLALALLAPATPARANAAYDRVATAFAQGGGQLDACAFTQQQLEDAIAGIPKSIAKFVPDLRTAMRHGIAEHKRGDCKGRVPGTSTSAVPPVTTPTTPTAPQPTTAPPATSAPAASAAHHHDRTPLVVAALALGALALLLLALWLLARARGWDPPWIARQRHAWGEAGFRTTTTWSEFTDWLRLGR